MVSPNWRRARWGRRAGSCSSGSPCRKSAGALTYGVLLCLARALGEFGAVSVVSGHIRGQTDTLPLHVEILHNEYHSQAAFACASLLLLTGVSTLLLRRLAGRGMAH